MKDRIQQRIITLMKQRGMNQRQLSEASGVSEVTITKIKNGESVTLDTLYRIEDALNATLLLIPNEDLRKKDEQE